MSKRQVAAILGQVRSNLVAMPFLRAFTGLLVKFLAESSNHPWDSKHIIPNTIKDQLKEVKFLLENWSGRNFPQNPTRFLHSDSSTHGWGGLDIQNGNFIQEFWRDMEGPPPPHKQKRAHCSYKHYKKSLKGRGNCILVSGQPGNILLPYKRGGGGKTPSM